jgi:hypothetical protein
MSMKDKEIDRIRTAFRDELEKFGASPSDAAKEIASQLGDSKENARRWAVETVIGVFGLNTPKREEVDAQVTLSHLTDDELRDMIGRLDAEIEASEGDRH